MAPSSRRVSQAPAPNVNLFCSQCDTQIGVFVNEWIRLTSSYVHPAHPGKHFGTEIGNKTQVVPDGVFQKAVQGCTLAEVFCKKCSAALGQFCKAAPTPQQRRLQDEYFYKLSKTYLKDNETNTIVDAVFGYSGDIVQPRSVRPTNPPRSGVPPLPRGSQTPMQRSPESSLSALQYSESQVQPYHPSPLNNASYLGTPTPNDMEDRTTLEARMRAQDEKIAVQDQKIQQQDTQVRLMATLLETLRGTLDDLRTTMREMQSRDAIMRNEKAYPNGPDNIPNLPFQDTRNASSNEIDIDRLRAENAAIKARLEGLETARDRPWKDSDITTVLGKRKRRSSVTKSRAPTNSDSTDRYADPSCRQESSFIQMPTPQSSNSVENHSIDESSVSRSSSPFEGLSEVALQRASQASEELGSIAQHACAPPAQDGRSQVEKRSDFSDQSIVDPESNVPPRNVTRSIRAAETSDAAASPTVHALHESHRKLSGLQDIGPSVHVNPENSASCSQSTDIVIGDLETSTTQQPGADNVEFSDEDNEGAIELQNPKSSTAQDTQNRVGSVIDTKARANQDAQISQADPSEDASEVQQEQQVQPRTTRSTASRQVADPTPEAVTPDGSELKKRPGSRRTSRKSTERFAEGRSVAPEPAIPKVVRRRLPPEPFDVTTPTSYDEELSRKRAKLPKPKVQYTTKLLNIELKELGLDEWIDKDRKNPEYRAAVAEARKRQRELNKAAKLMSYGLGENGEPLPTPSNPGWQRSLSLDEAFKEATDALVVSGTPGLKSGIRDEQPLQVGVPHPQADPYGSARSQNHMVEILPVANYVGNRPTPAIQQNSSVPDVVVPNTARRQREEEIRRRDQIAKAAMEM